ncbi:hypothetical protein MJO29_008913 [Puccinia striiformis f. sp. tritici]|nr:hypothetical protein MJO29_008913 [Puccinia striiformis f. sp. tritici]
MDQEGPLQVRSSLRAHADLTGDFPDKTKAYQKLSLAKRKRIKGIHQKGVFISSEDMEYQREGKWGSYFQKIER